MNKVLGKFKKSYKKITSGEPIYTLPDIEKSVLFTPTYKLEDDEWFYIENFSQTKYCIKLLKKEISSAEYDSISGAELLKISHLCSIQNNRYYCFQSIKKSQRIQKKYISSTCKVKSENLILIEDFPELIYDQVTDKLYFKFLSKANNIFTGINELYREATEEEVEQFLSKEYITVQDDFDKKSIGISERKKLAITMDMYNKNTDIDKDKILKQFEENFPEKMDENGKFKIVSIEDFKILLCILREDAYKTRTGKRKVANSSKVV